MNEQYSKDAERRALYLQFDEQIDGKRRKVVRKWIYQSVLSLDLSEMNVKAREKVNEYGEECGIGLWAKNELYIADMPFDGSEAGYIDYVTWGKATFEDVDRYIKKEWARMLPKIKAGELLLERAPVNAEEAVEARKISWDECEKIIECEKIHVSLYDIPGRSGYYGEEYFVGDIRAGSGQKFEALAIVDGVEVWKVLEFADMEWGENLAGLWCDGRIWEPGDWQYGGPFVAGQPGKFLSDKKP